MIGIPRAARPSWYDLATGHANHKDSAMQRPRVGFRCFLLITTLATLVVATLAIRARTDTFRSALHHDMLAHRLRASVAWSDGQINEMRLIWERKTPPLVSHKWA